MNKKTLVLFSSIALLTGLVTGTVAIECAIHSGEHYTPMAAIPNPDSATAAVLAAWAAGCFYAFYSLIKQIK